MLPVLLTTPSNLKVSNLSWTWESPSKKHNLYSKLVELLGPPGIICLIKIQPMTRFNPVKSTEPIFWPLAGKRSCHRIFRGSMGSRMLVSSIVHWRAWMPEVLPTFKMMITIALSASYQIK